MNNGDILQSMVVVVTSSLASRYTNISARDDIDLAPLMTDPDFDAPA